MTGWDVEGPARAGVRWRMAADPDKPSFSERLTRAMIKADSRPDREVDEGPQTVEELEAASSSLDDRERLIGLAAAPLAGIAAIIVASSYGSKSTTHATSVDSTLVLVLFGLALATMALAWFRKRLFLGIVLALFGLSVFNLHYWEFGVPFLLIGSWYLVRAYRISQKLKLARSGGAAGTGGPSGRAQPNKRYTPPTAPPRPPMPNGAKKDDDDS